MKFPFLSILLLLFPFFTFSSSLLSLPQLVVPKFLQATPPKQSPKNLRKANIEHQTQLQTQSQPQPQTYLKNRFIQQEVISDTPCLNCPLPQNRLGNVKKVPVYVPIPIFTLYQIPIVHHYPLNQVVRQVLPLPVEIPIEHRINTPVAMPVPVEQKIIVPQPVPYGVKVPVPVPFPVIPNDDNGQDNDNKKSPINLHNEALQMINVNGAQDNILQYVKNAAENGEILNYKDNYQGNTQNLKINNKSSKDYIERNEKIALKNELIMDFEKLIQNPKNVSISECRTSNISGNNIPRFESKSDLNDNFPKFLQKEEEQIKFEQIPDP